MPHSASSEKTKTSLKRKRKEKGARQQALSLYDIYDTGGFDKDFFDLLQSQAPEDQKLTWESPVDSAELTEDKDKDTNSSNPKPLPPRPPRRDWNNRKLVSSSSPKKSGPNKFKGRKNKSGSGRARNANAYTNNGDNDGNSTSRLASPPLLRTPPTSLPLDVLSSPSLSNKTSRCDTPGRSDMELTENKTLTRSNNPSASPPTPVGIHSESSFRALISIVNSGPLSSPARDKSRENELEAIAGEDERGHDFGLHTATRFPTDPVDTGPSDLWVPPMPMLPSAQRQELNRSSDEICAEARAMSEISLPPGLETLMQTGGLNPRDNPSFSSRCPLHNDIQDPMSSVEVNSKYFADSRVSNLGANTNHLFNNRLCTKSSRVLPTNILHRNDPMSIRLQEAPGPHEPPSDQPATPYAGPLALTPPNASENPPPSRNKKTQPVKARPGSNSKKVSKYFPISKAAAGSSLPFPNTQRKSFGLIQETVAHDPFRLLVATIFLNKTKCEAANPIFRKVFEEFCTVESLANADVDNLASTIQPLGLHRQRARKIINLSKTWLSEPPTKGKRYRRLGYPKQHDGRDVKANECLGDEDPRFAWEVAHLPGIGPYAIDSWRIFCRDKLRGLAADYKGTGAAEGVVPEWKSVLPDDKELRAYLSWMWLKEGYSWDMETGELTPADPKLKGAASKNNLYVATDGLELSAKPGRAIVENLCTPTPLPGLKLEN